MSPPPTAILALPLPGCASGCIDPNRKENHEQHTLTGNLTDHVDLRYTNNGQAVANFTVAVNRRFQRNGSWEETTDGFFRVAAFGQLAESGEPNPERLQGADEPTR